MNARTLAVATLERIGCHPKALPELDTEASDGIALLAVTFARLYEHSLFFGVSWGDWPDFFMAPGNRIDVAPFVSKGWQLHSPEYNAKLIEWDREKIRAWLRYARERIKRIERRLMIRTLAEMVVTEPQAVTSLFPEAGT